MSIARYMLLVILCQGAMLSLSGQADFSVGIGSGGQYLLPEKSLRQQGLLHNANAGIPLTFSLEAELSQFWLGLTLEPIRQRWESGPGNMLWPGRNKPIHQYSSWWAVSGSLLVGYRIPAGFLNQMNLSPYLGVSYDRHQPVHYCGAGATLARDLTVPVTQAEVATVWHSGLKAGGGFIFDYQLSHGTNPVWLRMGVSAWWRQVPLLSGNYHLWKNGGQMAQQPPWGLNPPRPGQHIQRESCPESFSTDPDQTYEISLPGHHLSWTIGLRFDL